MFSRPKILFLVSLLFEALLNPKFNPYLLCKFLIFYHSSNSRFRPCLHKHVFDLKRNCLDTFLPFVYTETSKTNMYTKAF